MPIDPDRFRALLGHLAGGVAVVTSRQADGAPSGLTATAVCSVSLAPPLVLACLDATSNTHRAIRSSGIFALHLLSDRDAELARRFAGGAEDKFRGLEVGRARTGAPVLPGTLAHMDCRVVDTVEAGDHTIFVGRVDGGSVGESGARGPLVYYRGEYTTLDGAGSPREGVGP